ncbi:MAG: poly-gamma-glutamate biosynthesis protein PgsC [Myxococcales bacterium]|nr:poly-gamma-glutamate biosynthesis protein PgsC [Myxococcales bacterium]MDH5306105.1 poly-gamma-glutamate biosynthesis protein PgsC [Myxococcales bacterium]MDH5565433.1 poly-gamma-glutamate biosynthesis protein PgsC [Myxococcales bacterium]
MTEQEILYIAIGLFVSLLYSELFGVAPGGIIVPGYLALGLGDPMVVAITIGVSLLTFFVVRVLSTVTIIYGRRRTVLMLLIGFLLGSLVRWGLGAGTPVGPFEIDVIGYIIPGLIAIWMDRQGVVVSVASSLTASIVTRLSGLLLLGV